MKKTITPVQLDVATSIIADQLEELQKHRLEVNRNIILDVATLFRKSVHTGVCMSFAPWKDPSNPGYVHSTCNSGANGVRFRGEKCSSCTLFNQDFRDQPKIFDEIFAENSAKKQKRNNLFVMPAPVVVPKPAFQADPIW